MIENRVFVSRSIFVFEKLIQFLDDTISFHECNDKIIRLLKNEKLFLGRNLKVLQGFHQRNKLEVAFAGSTSAGKSSLINALMGENVLPVGINPVTPNIIKLIYSKKIEYSVTLRTVNSITIEQHKYGSAREVSKKIESFASKANTIDSILIESSSFGMLKKLGVTFVDTPGFSSPLKNKKENHSKRLINYLDESNPILFFISSLDPIKSEKEFLKNNLQQYLFDMIISKADQNNPPSFPNNSSSDVYSPDKMHKIRENLGIPNSCEIHVVSTLENDKRLITFKDYLESVFAIHAVKKNLKGIFFERFQLLEKEIFNKSNNNTIWPDWAVVRFKAELTKETSLDFNNYSMKEMLRNIYSKWMLLG